MKFNSFQSSSLLVAMIATSTIFMQGCKPGQFPVQVDVAQDFEFKPPGAEAAIIKRGDIVNASVSNGFAGTMLTLNGQSLPLNLYSQRSRYDVSQFVPQGVIQLQSQTQQRNVGTALRRDSCYHSYYGCGFDVIQGEYSCGFKNEWGYREIKDVTIEKVLQFKGQLLQDKTEVASFSGSIDLGTQTQTTTGDCRSNTGNF